MEKYSPGDEKRMVVVLDESRFDDWLSAPADESREFLRPYPAERLTARAGSVRASG